MAVKLKIHASPLESILKKAIYENKIAVLVNKDTLGDLQKSYLLGYIKCLEETLEIVIETNKKEQENIYKVCPN
jgi:hypothetical protein